NNHSSLLLSRQQPGQGLDRSDAWSLHKRLPQPRHCKTHMVHGHHFAPLLRFPPNLMLLHLHQHTILPKSTALQNPGRSRKCQRFFGSKLLQTDEAFDGSHWAEETPASSADSCRPATRIRSSLSDPICDVELGIRRPNTRPKAAVTAA